MSGILLPPGVKMPDEQAEPVTPEPPVEVSESAICRIETFVNGKGNRVEHLNLVSGEMASDVARFHGFAIMNIMVNAPGPGGRMQKVPLPPQEVSFPIDADTIEEAFSKYEEAGAKAQVDYTEQVKKKYEEHVRKQQQRIVVPSEHPSQNMPKRSIFQRRDRKSR